MCTPFAYPGTQSIYLPSTREIAGAVLRSLILGVFFVEPRIPPQIMLHAACHGMGKAEVSIDRIGGFRQFLGWICRPGICTMPLKPCWDPIQCCVQRAEELKYRRRMFWLRPIGSNLICRAEYKLHEFQYPVTLRIDGRFSGPEKFHHREPNEKSWRLLVSKVILRLPERSLKG